MKNTFIISGLLVSATANSAPAIKVAIIDTGIAEKQAHLCKSGHKDFTYTGLKSENNHGPNISGLIDKEVNSDDDLENKDEDEDDEEEEEEEEEDEEKSEFYYNESTQFNKNTMSQNSPNSPYKNSPNKKTSPPPHEGTFGKVGFGFIAVGKCFGIFA